MILFPPSTAVTVVIDGAPVRTYQPAFIRNGRTYAPAQPFLTSAAERVWVSGGVLNAQRNGRSVHMRTCCRYVPLAPLLRALGASVLYVDRQLIVRFPHVPVAPPTPFDAALPEVSPRAVFTPMPVQTPRPVWTGNPLPRRTPLPATAPTPH